MVGNPRASLYVTKYVINLNMETVVTEVRIYADQDGKSHIPPEYRSDVVYGADVKSLAVSLYNEGVMSNDRITAFLNATSDGKPGLSKGRIYSFCRKFSEQVEKNIRHLKDELLNRNVVTTDATPVTVNCVLDYIRNTSTKEADTIKTVESPLLRLSTVFTGKNEYKLTHILIKDWALPSTY